MAETNKPGKSAGRPSRRDGRRRYFREKGAAGTPSNEQSEAPNRIGGRTGAQRTSAQRSPNAEQSPNMERAQRAQRSSNAQRSPNAQRPQTGQRSPNAQRAVNNGRQKPTDMEARRPRRRRRRGQGERGEVHESRQENATSIATLDYAMPQSVFIYNHVSRGDLNERYESKVEHFSSIGRKIEDYGIDLSKLIAEDGTIHLPKMDGKIAEWEEEPAVRNAENRFERN